MPPLINRSVDSEDESDPVSDCESSTSNDTSYDRDTHYSPSNDTSDSLPQPNDRSPAIEDDSDPDSDCASESDTINTPAHKQHKGTHTATASHISDTDDEFHTTTPYDPPTSYIFRQRQRQQHRRKQQPILRIHGDALGVKEDDSVRILFVSFNGLAAWKPRNDKILLARHLIHRLEVDCYTCT